jgi:hypothetical protein
LQQVNGILYQVVLPISASLSPVMGTSAHGLFPDLLAGMLVIGDKPIGRRYEDK